MHYGFKWFELEQRFYLGTAGDGDFFVPQVSEMQPKGHWIDSNGRPVIYNKGKWPGLIERLLNWKMKWVSYPKP